MAVEHGGRVGEDGGLEHFTREGEYHVSFPAE
jgi:hypothetical protein